MDLWLERTGTEQEVELSDELTGHWQIAARWPERGSQAMLS